MTRTRRLAFPSTAGQHHRAGVLAGLSPANSIGQLNHLLRCLVIAVLVVASISLGDGLVNAGDWPQILGPNRNGIAVDEGPLSWPAAGPPRLWTSELGAGFAGPAVAGNRVVVFHRVGRSERVECLDAASGKHQWQTEFPASYPGGVNPDNGPRCVPLVHDRHVYLFGASGNVHCVRLADGKPVWSREASIDYKAPDGYFGAGSTPIVADNKLLVNVGGADAGIVAFELDTGKTAWQATDERASYSSPTLANVNDTLHAIFVTRLKCLAIDPRDGRVTFAFPFGRTGPTVNAATPLVFDGQLFVCAAYEVGAKLARIGVPPTTVWANDDSMSSQYTTCVYRDGHLYGIHGREDYQSGQLRCVESQTGKVTWSVPLPATGHLILVGDQLLILSADGQLALASARADKYVEQARVQVSADITRALPALANGRFYFRDNADHTGKLYCLQLAKP